MRTLIVVRLLSLADILAAAQNPNESGRNESLLIALENAWNQAQLHHSRSLQIRIFGSSKMRPFASLKAMSMRSRNSGKSSSVTVSRSTSNSKTVTRLSGH